MLSSLKSLLRFNDFIFFLLDGGRSHASYTSRWCNTVSSLFFHLYIAFRHNIRESQPMIVPIPANPGQMRQRTLVY